MIVFKRILDLVLWVEGDVTAYSPPSQEVRAAILDEIAEIYGESQEE